MEYSIKTNPVPMAGDKIRITRINNRQSAHFKVGDVIEVTGGKDNYCGKPAFQYEKVYEWGSIKGQKRKCWCGSTTYDWEIVARNGEPYIDKEQEERMKEEHERLVNEYSEQILDKVISSEPLMSALTRHTSEPYEISENIVTLAKSIARKMLEKPQD